MIVILAQSILVLNQLIEMIHPLADMLIEQLLLFHKEVVWMQIHAQLKLAMSLMVLVDILHMEMELMIHVRLTLIQIHAQLINVILRIALLFEQIMFLALLFKILHLLIAKMEMLVLLKVLILRTLFAVDQLQEIALLLNHANHLMVLFVLMI